LVSPLIFGAAADRHVGPVRVLRWIAVATAAAMAMASTGIKQGWNPWLLLALIQVLSLFSAPTWSISTTIVLARLTDARREFGPIRAMGTLGWMAGCWIVSALKADTSPLAGYCGALTWLALAAFTLVLPVVAPPKSLDHLTLRQRFGLDALSLLKNHDHRVVFVTAALVTIPLAAFYPFAPVHLRDLGFQRTSAWMTLGQVTEIAAMLGLSTLLLAAAEINLPLRARLCAAALRAVCVEWQGMGAGRSFTARPCLHALLRHGPHLSQRTRRCDLARAGTGLVHADDQRRGQPYRLSWHGLVVRGVRTSARRALVVVLGWSGDCSGGGVDLLPCGVSRTQWQARLQGEG
jgi:MFS family permease